MSAGLPGLGLGGLFFIFSALWAPFPELWRTLCGRSHPGAWRPIGRQLVQAVAMIVAIDLTLRLTYLLLSAVGAAGLPAADEGTVLPLDLIGITTGLLLLVLCGAKLAELALRGSSGRLPRVPEALPRVAPLRAIVIASVTGIGWFALLTVGASELSPLQRPHPAPLAAAEESAGAPEAEIRPRSRAAGGPPRQRPAGSDSFNGGAAKIVTGGTGGRGGGGDGGEPAIENSSPVPLPAPVIPPSGGKAPAVHAQSTAPSPEPKGSPPVETPAEPATPASTPGPPEGPAPEPAGPPAEPPPQAPAKGIQQ